MIPPPPQNKTGNTGAIYLRKQYKECDTTVDQKGWMLRLGMNNRTKGQLESVNSGRQPDIENAPTRKAMTVRHVRLSTGHQKRYWLQESHLLLCTVWVCSDKTTISVKGNAKYLINSTFVLTNVGTGTR